MLTGPCHEIFDDGCILTLDSREFALNKLSSAGSICGECATAMLRPPLCDLINMEGEKKACLAHTSAETRGLVEIRSEAWLSAEVWDWGFVRRPCPVVMSIPCPVTGST